MNEALEVFVRKEVEDLDFDLVELRMGGTARRPLLDVRIDRRDGSKITVDDCARVSRALEPRLDASRMVGENYVLEVSSPGVDRPLTRQSDFDLFEGFEARLETDRMIEGRKRFKGVLAGTDGDNIAIDLEGEEDTALIPFDWLIDAKLVLTDELMKAGAEKRAARNDNTETED